MALKNTCTPIKSSQSNLFQPLTLIVSKTSICYLPIGLHFINLLLLTCYDQLDQGKNCYKKKNTHCDTVITL